MEAETILSIAKCGDLFPYGEDKVKAKYKELAREWHPDRNRNPDSPEVFTKITELYRRALQLLEDGQWEKTDFVLIGKTDGKKIALNYENSFTFELGTCYAAKTKVVYVLGSDKEKYYQNAVRRIKGLGYKDKKMKADLSRFLPEIYQTFRTNKGEYGIVLNKPEEAYPLKMVYESFGRQIEHRHVAWIMSRLCNLACYLKCSGLVHNGINMNNCFIAPKTHSVLLPGGWWYATKEGESMVGTTKDIFGVMPVSAKSAKKSSPLTDLEAIKLLGRQLLGETNCRKLSLDDTIPKPFVRFLTGGSGSDAYEEFSKWDKALMDSYGERKFIPMEWGLK